MHKLLELWVKSLTFSISCDICSLGPEHKLSLSFYASQIIGATVFGHQCKTQNHWRPQRLSSSHAASLLVSLTATSDRCYPSTSATASISHPLTQPSVPDLPENNAWIQAWFPLVTINDWVKVCEGVFSAKMLLCVWFPAHALACRPPPAHKSVVGRCGDSSRE